MSTPTDGLAFPEGFLFGAASAAFQIEGSPAADGKGPSIWDEFSKRRGAVRTGETAEIACDHYRRWPEDVAIMRELGLGAYRFSFSWPRIQREGRGKPNPAGLDFYSRLVDGLLEAGLRPFPTIFHWDLPLALQREERGFLSRDAAHRLADYAEILVRALGDRVRDWITVNEPFEFAAFGHVLGSQAPGLRRPWAYFRVIHNILLGHALALERIRSISPALRAGPALSQTPVFPARPGGRDEEAALLADQFMNRITLDPILKGRYPIELMSRAGPLGPRIRDGDMEAISAPCDFVGLNYYSRERASWRGFPPFMPFNVTGKDGGRGEGESGGVRSTAMGWEVWPEGLGRLARMLRDEYGNPLVYVTENGAAFSDEVERGPEGPRVRDTKRIEFLRDYLGALRDAIKDGARVGGYFVWSLTDNFEWAEGTRPRFGLVRVDYGTQARIVKDSGYWYRDLIRSQGRGQAENARSSRSLHAPE